MQFLIIQTAFIGDVALTTPLIRALQEANPGVEIHFIATRAGCELLDGLANVQTHEIDKKNGLFKTLKQVRKRFASIEFDRVYCVHRSLRSLLIAKSVHAKNRVAFSSVFSKLLGFETVDYPPYSENIHYAQKPLKLARLSNQTNLRPMLAVSPAAHPSLLKKAGDILQQPYVVLSPFAQWETKMWFADRYARLAGMVSARYKLPVVIIGEGKGNESTVAGTMVEKIQILAQTSDQSSALAAKGAAISLVGKTSLEELKALIQGAALLISCDSAPVHIAAAFDVKVVAVFGPTVKKWGFFPLSSKYRVVERPDLPCRPCSLHGPRVCPKKHFKCMDEIAVEDVFRAVQDLM